MRELSADEIKEYSLDILIDLDKVCKHLNLRYSIAFGTMIGAVRHHGFIPWDDDIDVIMPRDDYNRLVRDGSELFKTNHKIVSINENDKFGAPLPKIIDTNTKVNQIGHTSEKMDIGVYIDIFILDKIPSVINQQKKLFKKCQFWYSAWRFSGNAPSANNSILQSAIRKIVNKTNLSLYYAKKLMNVDLLTKKCNSDLYTILVFKAYSFEKNIQKLNEFDECIEIEFEGHMVKMLSRYDEYLTIIYGDYMKLPPIDKQVTHHDFVAFLR